MTIRPAAAPLRTLAEIAAAVAQRGTLDALFPGVLAEVDRTVDASDCTVWLGDATGLRRGWGQGLAVTTPTEAAKFVTHVGDAPPVAGAPLRTVGQTIGVLTVRPRHRLTDEQQLFLGAVADILAPVLSHAQHAQRLEGEVAERTAQIEKQRRFMAKVVDSLPVGLYVIDREFRIEAWNHKRETGALGVSRGEALGRPIFDVLHRQPAEVLRREFQDVFDSGRLQQFHMESTASGEVRTYRISKIPMRLDDGQVTHVITIGEDITDWRDAQERIAQTEKLAALGTLAAGVMHEINNPLATIAACAEATAMRVDAESQHLGAMSAELREALDLVTHEVQRCKRITDTVLGFSRPQPATKSLVDVNAVIDRTLFLLKHHPRFKRLTVAVEADRTIGPTVLADEEQLVQVFMALLLNAVDAMHEQGTVTLRSRADDRLVVAEVIDEGVGIRRAELNKIFEPFYTTKPPGRGTGLGLSVCYAIVSAHGGRIEVDSIPGAGSVFRILLPRHSQTT
ncbi:MAG: ATP-binding protein [Gemmatimonadota bacterium]|nr:ATP-binding protein [Gemmatimonadota bacterium]